MTEEVEVEFGSGMKVRVKSDTEDLETCMAALHAMRETYFGTLELTLDEDERKDVA